MSSIDRLLRVFVLLSCAALPCCTVLARLDHVIQDDGLYARPYAGTYLDCTVIYSGEFVQGSKSVLFRVAALLDLPVSLVLDTLLLPMDVGLWILRDRPGKDRRPERQTIKPDS
jgi:uncharacterized protein YceK